MASSQKSYWLRSGLFTILERGSVFVFGFGSIYLLTRGLSKSEFGTWVLFYTISSFIEVGRNGLLQNALVKFLTNAEEENYAKINTASAVNNILLTGICVIFLLLFSGMISQWLNAPQLALMLCIYCVTTTLLIPFQQANFIQMANLDFRGVFWGNFVKQGVFFFYVLILFFLGKAMDLIHLAFFQIITAVVGSLTTLFFARKYLKFSKVVDWNWVRKLFNFGRYVFGTNISTMTYKSIDKLMLGYLLLPASVGIYEWAIKITNLVEVPTFSIASIVFPQSARKMEDGGKPAVKKLYEKSVGAIFALILPFMVFIYFFAEFVILFLAGDAYSETVEILQLTVFYGLFIPFAVQFGTILDSIGKPKINFYFTLAGTCLNIVFNYLFITLYGIKGAAYGTLISYAITFAIHQFVLYKLLNVKAYKAFGYMLGAYVEGYHMVLDFLKKKFVLTKTKI